MSSIAILGITIIILCLVFDYINGFHDTANAIAIVVSTRVLSPRAAIIMAATLDLVGALIGTTVAHTIIEGIIDMKLLNNSQFIVLAAIFAAILWNLVTWFFGIPSSSSHALIGGLIGSALIYGILHGADWHKFLKITSITQKVIIPLFMSPILGFIAGFIIMVALYWIVYKMHPMKVKNVFAKFQILSSALVALSHGMNDAQKSMGLITMTLFISGFIAVPNVPLWVKFACAIAMACGTLSGGWKIIKTMGNKIFKMETIHGFAAQASSALVIFGSSLMGAPISTTQVISSSILGVGATKRLSAVRWGIAGHIVTAWFITIPITACISGAFLWLLHIVFPM